MKPTAISATSILLASALVFSSGCKKTADNSVNYKTAINSYYASHVLCLWPSPQKFPVQLGASDSSKTAPYDALVDQGLLSRTTSEKKMIIISKRETNYDLSDKGRSVWTADPSEPGAGNFCYGHLEVSSIDSATPNSGQPGASTVVNFHYAAADTPGWAKAAETQTAFPQVQSTLAGGAATATLNDTANSWQVSTPPPAPSFSSSPDGSVVQ